MSCDKKIVNFHLLAVLLYILSTIVGKIHVQAFLIHVHSSSFITRSFTDHEQSQTYSLCTQFGDEYNTRTQNALWQLTGLSWVHLSL
jgi:hypothetical protein